MISGVPQGSILGPLLFVNDMPQAINNSHCFLFADDAKLLKVINTSADHNELQEDLMAVSKWCDQWNLTLNSSKCVALHFSSKPQQPTAMSYCIGETSIPFLETQRDLDVTVSGTLSWSYQCDHVCTKAYRSLHVIRCNVPSSSSVKLKRQLYLTLVKSHVSYCCQLWRPFLIKDFQSIEKIQRRATKYILNDSSSDYKSRLLSLNMLPLMYWLDLQDLVFLVKCLKDPHNTMNIYRYVNFVSTNKTRASTTNKLQHKLARLSTTRHFYFIRVVWIWNSLPCGIYCRFESICTIKQNKAQKFSLGAFRTIFYLRKLVLISFCVSML